MSHAKHPRTLKLPREENGLATSKPAVRRVQELLPAFLEDTVVEAEANGLVVALDGGVETTVAAAMAVDAVGAERVTGLVVPVQLSEEAPARTAEAVASMLEIEHHRLQLQPVLAAFQSVVGETGQPTDDLVAIRNASERLRMACTYYVANTTGKLVVGTVNRTERLLGSVAKYGENGVDVDLFGDLYRTELRSVAEDMEVPSDIMDRSTTRFDYADRSDAEELGIEPTTLDSLLHFAVDRQLSAAETADRVGVDPSVVRRTVRWCSQTRHKRHTPPKPSMAN